MTSAYFKELKRYTFENVLEKLSINEEKGKELINRLKSYGLLKTVRKIPNEIDLTEIDDEEIDIIEDEADSYSIYYVFKFVGVITIKECILICYPKYINKILKPEIEMKQILNVIKKYDSEEQVINLYNGESNEKTYNFLAIVLFLINDYYNNGLYSNHKEIIEVNGEGDILWDKTINETYVYISNDRPYYLEVYTRSLREDDTDYFTRLHQFILTECSNKLNTAEINTLFDIESINLFDGTIEEFGDVEYILYRLERELKVQYITQKQIILKTLYAYISHGKACEYGLGISFYGTNHFNLVWEKVCSNVFDNKLNTKISKLPLPVSSEYKDKKNNTLTELIEKPLWKTYESNEEIVVRQASKTLTPDLISIFKIEEGYGFAIFDAKYYNIEFRKDKVYNQPGVGDVTKQYLYQLAYKDFIELNGYKFIVNAFLLPDERDDIENIGQAEMGILAKIENRDLKNIEIIELPAKKMYELYINDKNMNFDHINSEIRKNNISKNEDYDFNIVAEKLQNESGIMEEIADISVKLDKIITKLSGYDIEDKQIALTNIRNSIEENNSYETILDNKTIIEDVITNAFGIINK